ncbi:MAG TPA: hypothetical protein VEC76_14790 [Streptosporangiaceae bacterium]|nr:hypothetical protein [Streptosporangiaceae bacterium]
MSTEHSDAVTTSSAAGPVQFRLVTSYASRSAEAADDNQRRVEAVFAELDNARPGNVSYLVLRLADDSFVHISFHGHAPGETNPIASTDAFAHFLDGHGERRDGEVNQQKATLVGAYVTLIG